MTRFTLSLVVFIATMVASMLFHNTMAQTTHVVGDTLRWTIAPGGAAAYTTWASQQSFTVGDVLVFNFMNGQHDVAEVAAAAYDPCTSTNPISLTTTSPASIPLTTAGTHYYICTFTSHCQAGQKLTINVSAAAATPPSVTPTTPPPSPSTTNPRTPTSPPPTTTPTTPTTPTEPCPPTSAPSASPPTITTGSTTSPPPPSGGASSFNAMVPVSLLAIGLAFLNY